MDKKALFLQIYANLPLESRKEVIAVLDSEPITWAAARIEIENDTESGQKILDFLIEAQIIK
jgi:hypothetical protein